jgi:hypothetical protein
MVVKSWICSAALPLTTNCGGTFCADAAGTTIATHVNIASARRA